MSRVDGARLQGSEPLRLSIRQNLHRMLTPLLHGSGVVSAMRNSSWRRERLGILCYHSFSATDEHEWDPCLYMRPDALVERFEFLREQKYRVLSLSEGLKRLYTGTLPDRSVVLTFDDGTRDFATTVVPLLERYQYPATVYLSTWYCGQPRPIFRGFAKYVFWKGRSAYRGGPIWKMQGPFDLQTADGRNRLVDELRIEIRRQGISLEDRDGLMSEIAAGLGVNYQRALTETNFHLMTPEQIARLAQSPLVQVELHTHRHQSPLRRDLFQREIRENRERIEMMTGKPAHHFCYPSGVVENEFLPWLQELQVDSATTGESGLASRASHPLLLPRIVDTSHLGIERLGVWLSGAAHLLRRLRHIATSRR